MASLRSTLKIKGRSFIMRAPSMSKPQNVSMAFSSAYQCEDN